MVFNKTHRGFTAAEVIIIVVIAVILIFLGFKAWELSQAPAGDSQAVPPVAPATNGPSPDINSPEDLDDADKTLDSTDVEGSESGELDTQTNF